MLASLRRALVIALVPAFVVASAALAAPKAHKGKKPATKPATTEPAPDKTEPKPGTDVPADTRGAEPAKPVTPAPPNPAAATPSMTGSGGGGAGGQAGATNGGGAGTAEQPAANEPDVDSLRQEYLALRDELFKSRARANAVASQLYSTRVTIHFTWTSVRFYGVSKASIRLDGANVYDNTGGGIAADDGVRFDGYIAPGRHLITFHVEATGKDDDSFTSTTESQIVVKAVANKDLVVAAKGRDSGDIAYEWKRKESGSYGLGIDVAVKTIARPAEAAAAKGSTK
ncbi:MAG: hypothetical protein JWO36_1040 [Myxococcales bacterium]|nr:hypothetical protein [Myxococcales bacterium]